MNVSEHLFSEFTAAKIVREIKTAMSSYFTPEELRALEKAIKLKTFSVPANLDKVMHNGK